MITPPDSETVMERMHAESGGRVLLAFSCGKDSVAAWLALRARGFEIHPFYMYLVPGLQFVERSLDYYEQWSGQHIMRVPHPSLYRMIANFVYQPPERCAIIEAAQLPKFSYDDLHGFIKDDLKLPQTTYVAAGVRAVDSPQRMMAVRTHGPVNAKRKTFWPVWDWRIQRVYDTIKSAGVKLPVDYRWFGRSFDGIDYRFVNTLRTVAPDDYQRILDWFPLADLDSKRREYASQN